MPTDHRDLALEVSHMSSLFDPYTHTRLMQLREEQLAKKARRRQALGLDARGSLAAPRSIAAIVHSLTSHPGRGKVPTRPPFPPDM